jgi:hypothetical protein
VFFNRQSAANLIIPALVMAMGAVALAPAVVLGAVDLAPPAITGTAGDNGWLRSDAIVKWTSSGETSTTGCDTQHLTADTPGATFTCMASDDTGSVSRTVTVRIDQTPPVGVVATASRPPDVSPFYTAPLPITWSATDVTSGIAGCTTLTYAGPDGPAVAPAGTCRDRAGNISAPLPFTFNYNTVPPPSGPVAPASTTAAVPAATGAASRPPTTTKPKAKAKLPTLRWRTRSKAKYYNLQLFRNGHKILSAWPTTAHYTLKPSWRYRGHTYRLTAGRYRWYVWPGYGPRAAHRYGHALAKGTVKV